MHLIDAKNLVRIFRIIIRFTRTGVFQCSGIEKCVIVLIQILRRFNNATTNFHNFPAIGLVYHLNGNNPKLERL